jgi:hypothetical protein
MFDKIEWGASIAPSLDALLRRASQVAEEMFEETGYPDMVWLIQSPDKGQAMFITPIFNTAGYKDDLSQFLRALFKDNGVSRYAFAADSWVRGPDGEVIGEIMALSSEDDREAHTARREIIRPPQGKPFLGKLSKIEIDKRPYPVGRFDGLLRRRRVRSTEELPDDVGTVFITNVPGAPFQVMGRRGPTGELFAGRFFEVEAWPNGEEMIEQGRREIGGRP